MSFKVTPLDMITAPNYWAAMKNGRWDVIDPNAVTLWFQLGVSDALGDRRYVSAAGAVMEVTFQRADLIQTGSGGLLPVKLTNTAQSVVKTATPHALDRSLYSMALTALDIQTVVAGTVKFKLTESGVVTTWVQNYLLTKSLTAPGN